MEVKRAQRFLPLDALRFLAALGVVSFHVVVATDVMVLDSLYLLVDFFFVLSGFVLLPTMPRSFTNFGSQAKYFLVRRAFRLFPMVITVIAVFWLAYYLQIRHATATGSWFEQDRNFTKEYTAWALILMQIVVSGSMMLVVPLWSLSAEWLANIFFTPLTAIKRSIGLISGIGAGYYFIWIGLTRDQEWIDWIGPIRHWEAFGRAVVGIGIGLLLRAHHQKLAKVTSPYLVPIALYGVWWTFEATKDFGYETIYFAAPIFGFFILQISQFQVSETGLIGKSFRRMGLLSFGLYAYHNVVITNFDHLVQAPNYWALPDIWNRYFLTKAVVVTVVSLVLADLTIRFVEKPAKKLEQKVLKSL